MYSNIEYEKNISINPDIPYTNEINKYKMYKKKKFN